MILLIWMIRFIFQTFIMLNRFLKKKEGCCIFFSRMETKNCWFLIRWKKILISKNNHRILKTFKKNLHKSISSFLNAPLSKVHEGWTRRYINDESCLIFKESWIRNNFFFNWAWNYMYIDHYNISKNTEIVNYVPILLLWNFDWTNCFVVFFHEWIE